MANVDHHKSIRARMGAVLLRVLCINALLAASLSSSAVAEPVDVGPNLAAGVGQAETATIVIKRLSDGQYWIANPDRAQQRFSPASTSKIPHSLIALENGLATPATVFQWDGVPRSNRAWNQNHTLQSAFQKSVVWVYQDIARTGGQTLMSEGLRRLNFGNADVGTVDQLTTYWLDDTLLISAQEQVAFLSKLALEELPLSETTYKIARDIMVSDTHANWIMRSKTGWRYSQTDMDVGWFVGWLECANEDFVFALNMDMPDTRSLSRRRSAAFLVLQDIGAFDCD